MVPIINKSKLLFFFSFLILTTSTQGINCSNFDYSKTLEKCQTLENNLEKTPLTLLGKSSSLKTTELIEDYNEDLNDEHFRSEYRESDNPFIESALVHVRRPYNAERSNNTFYVDKNGEVKIFTDFKKEYPKDMLLDNITGCKDGYIIKKYDTSLESFINGSLTGSSQVLSYKDKASDFKVVSVYNVSVFTVFRDRNLIRRGNSSRCVENSSFKVFTSSFRDSRIFNISRPRMGSSFIVNASNVYLVRSVEQSVENITVYLDSGNLALDSSDYLFFDEYGGLNRASDGSLVYAGSDFNGSLRSEDSGWLISGEGDSGCSFTVVSLSDVEDSGSCNLNENDNSVINVSVSRDNRNQSIQVKTDEGNYSLEFNGETETSSNEKVHNLELDESGFLKIKKDTSSKSFYITEERPRNLISFILISCLSSVFLWWYWRSVF